MSIPFYYKIVVGDGIPTERYEARAYRWRIGYRHGFVFKRPRSIP